ncbi:hypothetical protein [Pseudohoeflea coraliihabitans]|uniref:Uncharacterized protein n=1 Tax=Pseudohoeflea coraliihabitans TaxID=2860393 RepID=A0ABS6WTA8_9HYPH|nr:hypothetical protein [Pseudohoeflea sp. DP4N28-3]MBW3099190.1 hypothetical protein [Pseudohoeflea sp. DP4N28-3]
MVAIPLFLSALAVYCVYRKPLTGSAYYRAEAAVDAVGRLAIAALLLAVIWLAYLLL